MSGPWRTSRGGPGTAPRRETSRGEATGTDPLEVVKQCIYFPPEVGGLESHVYHLARALVGLGHGVSMVTSRSQPGVAKEEIMDGIRVRRVWLPARNALGWSVHSLATTPVTWRRARAADLVHAHTFASGVPAALVRALTGTPVVLTLHTSHFLRLVDRPAWRPVLRWIVRAADRVLATSREIRRVASDLAGVEVEAITNGVDVDHFRPAEPAERDRSSGGGEGERPDGNEDGSRNLVVPRRLFHKNGVEYLVRALPELRRAEPVRVTVVGDGPERERLERLAARLGVSPQLRFLGARPHAEMPEILRRADVVVIPSLVEATSVAALEAMACGVPVAASRVGGLPEIVDEEVGTLFRPADPTDLASRVVALLRRPDLDEVGRRGRRRVVERWSNAELARHHVRIYREVRRDA